MDRIGVVGAGTMGCGIAHGAAQHGYTVRLTDRDPAAAARGLAAIEASLARAVDKGKMSATTAEATRARLVPGDVADLADCGLVIEAIYEDPAAKATLFSALTPIVSDEAVLATNTSSLRVDDLARAVRAPQRFLGLHYFFPAAVNPLVEVVRGKATSQASMDRAFAFVHGCGKQPIACRDVFGFAINRFFVPYLNEAVRLADEGWRPAEIDAVACQAFGTAAGPFRVMDLTKPAIALHAARTLANLGEFYAPAPGLIRIGGSGESWNAGEAALTADADMIAERLQAAVFLAVLQELDEQVAAPEDIDLGARLGLQWQWQPCAAMRALGRARVEALVAPLAARHGAVVPPA